MKSFLKLQTPYKSYFGDIFKAEIARMTQKKTDSFKSFALPAGSPHVKYETENKTFSF